MEGTKSINIESNNGGTYVKISQLDDEVVYLEVGHECVVVFEGKLPAFVLGMMFSELDLKEIKELIGNYNPTFRKEILSKIKVNGKI